MPTREELAFDPRARAEARQKMLALPQEHLVKLLTVQRDESDKATDKLRAYWQESWRYFQCDVNYGDKEDWQSAVWIPTPWTAVEQACTVLKLGLLNQADPFKIDGVDPNDKLLADKVWTPLLTLAFDKASFLLKFIDAMKVALATGQSCYLKFRYPAIPSPILDGLDLTMNEQTGAPIVAPRYQMRRQSALTVETVPPWKCYRDPHSRPGEQWSGSYFIHEDYVDRAVINNPRVYKNLESALAVGQTGGAESDGAAQDATTRGQAYNPHEFRKAVLASEWYGDILDENGDLCFPDAMLAVANHKDLIYGPVENPLWAVDPRTFRRKWPFIGFSPIRHPLRFEGFGILQAVTPLAVLLSNAFNMYADSMNWKINPPTEMNVSLLDETDDDEHYPGKLWRKIGDGQLLTPAAIGSAFGNEVLAFLQIVQTIWEQNAFVNNFVQGTEGSRKQITKGEVQIRTGQSMNMFDGMGRDIEEGGKACLELAHDFLSQYLTDWTDPNIASLVGPQWAVLLSAMDPATRMRELSGQFNYTFSGITAALQKADLLGRLMQAASLAAEGPYVGYTNPSQVLKVLYDAMGVRDKIDVSEEPAIPVSKINEMLMGGMAPGNGGPSAVPGRRPTQRQLAPSPNELSTAVGA